jgi:prepilin signal peptidase PulO-like enzyme (type II secretory pathway)
MLVTLWWLFFWTALGLCLGSFLNAVIYRLPRDESLRNPLWSFCPTCRHRIAWYDNLPVVSFLILRGQCRRCGLPIPTRYLVIEVTMALIVLMLLDAFFMGQSRAGLSTSEFGLTDRLDTDWPIFLAHVILFACLLPMAVIDLEHYWVDVRFTNIATIAGFALHTVWTPRHSMAWPRPGDTTAVMCMLALVGLVAVWVVRVCNASGALEDEDNEYEGDGAEDEATAEDGAGAGAEPAVDPPRPSIPKQPVVRVSLLPWALGPAVVSPSRTGGWVALLLLVGMLMALAFDASGAVSVGHGVRSAAVLLLFFLLTVAESTIERASDHEILEAIHQERHGARRMVSAESSLLIPAVVAAGLGWWIMVEGGPVAAGVGDVLHGRVHAGGVGFLRNWMPLQGFATAAAGYIIAGAIGWAVRIVFTLAFGKEAFGAGDIHLMAATGCVAGWPVVALGFILTCGLALVGWLATLPFKRTRALPLGPWLALSFLIVVVFYDALVRWPVIQRALYVAETLMASWGSAPRLGGL